MQNSKETKYAFVRFAAYDASNQNEAQEDRYEAVMAVSITVAQFAGHVANTDIVGRLEQKFGQFTTAFDTQAVPATIRIESATIPSGKGPEVFRMILPLLMPFTGPCYIETMAGRPIQEYAREEKAPDPEKDPVQRSMTASRFLFGKVAEYRALMDKAAELKTVIRDTLEAEYEQKTGSSTGMRDMEFFIAKRPIGNLDPETGTYIKEYPAGYGSTRTKGCWYKGTECIPVEGSGEFLRIDYER